MANLWFLKPVAVLILALLAASAFAEDKEPAKDEFSLRGELVYAAAGPIRSPRYYPGDVVQFRFYADQLATQDNGQVSASTQLELRSASNDLVSILGTGNFGAKSSLVTNTRFFAGYCRVPYNAAPGKMKVFASVTDKVASLTKSMSLDIEVLEKPTTPYPILARFSCDRAGQIASSGQFTLGEVIYLQCSVTGLDLAETPCKCIVSLTIHEEGKEEPIAKKTDNSFEINAAPVNPTTATALFFNFTADRQFKGFARVTVKTDNNDATTQVDIPFEVLPLIGSDPPAK